MERENKTVKTPVEGLEVILKAWLTGGEKRSLIAEADPKKSQEIMIKAVVVSIGGDENVIERIDAMHGKDFDFVMLELAKVINDSSYTEKKNS